MLEVAERQRQMFTDLKEVFCCLKQTPGFYSIRIPPPPPAPPAPPAPATDGRNTSEDKCVHSTPTELSAR